MRLVTDHLAPRIFSNIAFTSLTRRFINNLNVLAHLSLVGYLIFGQMSRFETSTSVTTSILNQFDDNFPSF